ncbi:MAG: hypothetical protein ATN35_12445 [Epulopiscium sp. Nele67-Bin004]|nr:MAG: hypothetical protein ATN35_12445 [Epulopiscium sp. Nele67-Bin004]
MRGLIMLSAVSIIILTGCTRTARDVENTREMLAGQVVEVEGPEDQYGWLPHLRLTFENNQVSEVYFDYINGDSEKKSQDEEYNSTMQEKTGMSAEDAMKTLRNQLVKVQDPGQIEIIAGATQTSKEFIEMATKAITNFQDGKHSANNYGEDSEVTAAVNRGLGIEEPKTSDNQSSSKYFNGGDGNDATADAGA